MRGFQWSQGQERDEVSDGTEMEIERHWEEKKLMNSLQLQDFS